MLGPRDVIRRGLVEVLTPLNVELERAGWDTELTIENDQAADAEFALLKVYLPKPAASAALRARTSGSDAIKDRLLRDGS